MKSDEIFKGNLLLDFSEPYQLHEPRRIWEEHFFFLTALRIRDRCTKTAPAPGCSKLTLGQYIFLHKIFYDAII